MRTESSLRAGVWCRDRVDPEDPGYHLVEMRVPRAWDLTMEMVRACMGRGTGTERVDLKDVRFSLVEMRVPMGAIGGAPFLTTDWRDIYEALMEASILGPEWYWFARTLALARKIREENLAGAES